MNARPPDSTTPVDRSIASRDPPPPSSRLTRCSTVGAFGFGVLLPRDCRTEVSLDIQQPERHFSGLEAAPYVPENRAATDLAPENSDSAGATEFLALPGRRIAYRKRLATDRTQDGAGILFLPRFRSDMAGNKGDMLPHSTC